MLHSKIYCFTYYVQMLCFAINKETTVSLLTDINYLKPEGATTCTT